MALPLFEIVALPWSPPDPEAFDALILTSANAVRTAGAVLSRFAGLPVYAVGAATARAAVDAGMTVAVTGSDDGNALVATAAQAGVVRALHLGGRETRVVAAGIVAASIPVYASDPVPVGRPALAAIVGATALVHSPRAAERLGALIDHYAIDRGMVALAALSPSVADAAGPGWSRLAVAARPSDAALIDAAVAASD